MSLETKFRKPVPYNELFIGRGCVVKDSPRIVIIKTEILASDGTVLADGSAKYLRLPPEKIADADPHTEMCYLIADDVEEIVF